MNVQGKIPRGRGYQLVLALLVAGGVVMAARCLRPPTTASISWRPTAPRTRIIEVGSVAPDFMLPTTEGGKIALADLRGRRAALVFVNPRCPHCEVLTAKMSTLPAPIDGQILVVVAGNREQAIAMVQRQELHATALIDTAGYVGRVYKAISVPAVCVIDQSGRVEDSSLGEPGCWALLKTL